MARVEMLFRSRSSHFQNLDEITFGSWHKFEFDSAIKDFARVKPF